MLSVLRHADADRRMLRLLQGQEIAGPKDGPGVISGPFPLLPLIRPPWGFRFDQSVHQMHRVEQPRAAHSTSARHEWTRKP